MFKNFKSYFSISGFFTFLIVGIVVIISLLFCLYPEGITNYILYNTLLPFICGDSCSIRGKTYDNISDIWTTKQIKKYDNEQIKSISNFNRHEKPHGEQIEYDIDGNIKEISSYNNGKSIFKIEIRYDYDDNNKISSITRYSYNDGQILGNQWIEYYENGQIKSIYTNILGHNPILIEYYDIGDNTKVNYNIDNETMYQYDGPIKSKQIYNNNIKYWDIPKNFQDGLLEYYDKDGQIHSSIIYKKGEIFECSGFCEN